MKRLALIFSVILVGISGVLVAYSPNRLTTIFLAAMFVVVLLGMGFGIIPILLYADGFRNGIQTIEKSLEGNQSTSWVSVIDKEHFFGHNVLDKMFLEYRDKVLEQRKNKQIVTDLEDYINEVTLSYQSWQGVLAQIPGTLTGLGILGTFLGLIMGIGDISISSVEATVESVQMLLNGIEVAFYTSISGVVLSIIYNLVYRTTWNILNREMGVFMNRFHKQVIPSAEEQERYRERRDMQQVLERLDRLPKKGYVASANEEQETADSEKQMLPQICNALKNGEFVIYLQPRYDLMTEKVIGAEALVRWNHEKLGIVSPAKFIPVLEKSGYITKLDQYVWEQVLQLIRRWVDEGQRVLPVTINITRMDILALDIVSVFDTLLKKYNIPPRYLDIDFDQSICKDTQEEAQRVIANLRAMGLKVILDGFDGDFLWLESEEGKISVDALKLDLNLLSGNEDIQGILEMSSRMHYNVTAEGIENMEQTKLLRKYGCTEGQGYYFAKPVGVEEFEKKMAEA